MGQTSEVSEARARYLWRVAAGTLFLVLTGCDYWPPALQTQIEQLKADLQTIIAERARLEQQVVTLTRAREDLQAQVDQLTRSNKERASTIAELEHALKAARAPKAAAAPKPAGKPTPKATAQSTGKAGAKSTHTKSTHKQTTTKKKSADSGTYYKTIR